MGFLAPWFLGGLAALGVPVFVHLLRKHVTIPRPVSSLMFFERGTQSSTRHRRLRYLLLFALRFALLLLVVLAFAGDRTGRFFQHARGDAVCRCEAAGACDLDRETAFAEGAGDGAWRAVC